MAATSDMRRQLCGLICQRVWRSDPITKMWLRAELDALPFESRTTESIVSMAEHAAPEADVMRLLHMSDETMVDIEETYLCLACRDESVILNEAGRWARCDECNPYEPPEPKAKRVRR